VKQRKKKKLNREVKCALAQNAKNRFEAQMQAPIEMGRRDESNGVAALPK